MILRLFTPSPVAPTAKRDAKIVVEVSPLEVRSILNLAFDLTDGTTTATGAPFVLTLRFEGIVVQDNGLLITDAQGNFIFEAGPHDFGPNGDFSVICPLLQ